MEIVSLHKRIKNTHRHGLIIFILVLLAVWEKSFLKIGRKHHPDKTDEVMPYRTINAMDGSNTLIAYEFHVRNEDGRTPECSAIIKKVDPSRDDYKTFCRSVVADIVKTMGTDRISISIYDDYEAYDLSEVKSAQQFKILNNNELDSVSKHTVAVYTGDTYCDRGNGHFLYFYAEAKNKYTEQEVVDP